MNSVAAADDDRSEYIFHHHESSIIIIKQRYKHESTVFPRLRFNSFVDTARVMKLNLYLLNRKFAVKLQT
jgi:hypothetical protein